MRSDVPISGNVMRGAYVVFERGVIAEAQPKEL